MDKTHPTLTRDAGPVDPPAARGGVGFRSVRPFVVGVAAGGGVVEFVVPGLAGHRVGAGDRLGYVFMPVSGDDPGDEGGFYAATAFALDLVFTDGSRLSELEPRDQHGNLVSPDGQARARTLYVDQWNARVVSLAAAVGREVARVVACVRQYGRALAGFLDDVSITGAPARPDDALGWVRTTRGSHSGFRFSRGNTAPLVGLPHGGVFGLPMTDAGASGWSYCYHAHNRLPDNRPTIQAFATSHLPSPWIADRGVFQVMPSPLDAPDCDRVARGLAFDHGEELDGPHRYRVELEGGIRAELTAGEFALGFRFTLAGGGGSLILDHHGSVSQVSRTLVDGVFVVEALVDDRADAPAHFVHLRVDGVVRDETVVAEGRLGGFVVLGGGVVEAGIGISTIGFAEARRHLDAAGGFDEMVGAAARDWGAKLGTVAVDGGSDDQLTTVYSSLYRLFLYPNHHAEPPGRYRSPVDGQVRDGSYSANNGFWDTYRTCWPALSLLTPDAAGQLAQGFVQHYLDGGWTSRWSAPGPLDAMTGTTTDTVFASLAVAGIGEFDVDTAYESTVKNATVPSPDDRTGRKRLAQAIFRGYTSSELPEGMSWTLDNSINDWGAAVLARTLSERDPGSARLRTEYEYFARRSMDYRRVFHRELGFFLGRTADGNWRIAEDAYDPAIWGFDYTETNGWGTAFTAPHDGAGLAELHGGEAGLGAALDRFFGTREVGDASVRGSYDIVIHEMPEARDVRMGMFGLSNQPAHHIPFMYCFAGRHDDAHRIVTEARARLFTGSEIGQGYPGDEDNGEMSAWYLFSAFGFYPLVPSTGTYVLVPPLFPRVVLRPLGGNELTVSVRNPGLPYVRRVWVNGAQWDEISIDHATLAAGGEIEFELSETPCGWASGSRPVSASAVHGFHDLLVDRLAPEGSPLADNFAETVVELAAGQMVELALTQGIRPGLYTVTGDRPGALSWTVEWLAGDGTVVARDSREGEVFAWERQTRPFAGEGARGEATRVRFTARGPIALRQLEFFAEDTLSRRRAG